MITHKAAVAAALSLSLVACFEPADTELASDTTSAQAQVPSEPDVPQDWIVIPGECPSSSCGLNQALLADHDFHELKLGAQSKEKMTLLSFRNVRGENLEVVDDRVQIVPQPPGQNVVEKSARADDIIGAEMEIDRVGERFRIRIESIAATPFAANPNDEFSRIYELKYRPENGVRWRSLCRDGSKPTRNYAVLFAGDTYDKRTYAITTGSDAAGWFNVACVDAAIAKMHLLRHTTASQSHEGTVPTTLEERQALLESLLPEL